ncbi:hypothetical protein, partial [uncultured Chryseobacterium sp.]|uniref:hypothetical protein n=1 Tax=uncultured Chryseobacterium sp. TaxID=259322 RepID=UPI0025CE9222
LIYSRFQWGKDRTFKPQLPNLFNIKFILILLCGENSTVVICNDSTYAGSRSYPQGCGSMGNE